MDDVGLPIAGYAYGRASRSPVSLDELEQLKATVGFTDADADALAEARAVLGDQAEALVDSWREIIGAQDHLARWFFGPDGKPDDAYKAAVKARFVRWVVDLLSRPFDQAWLDYQEEIGLRHTPAKKNRTDGAQTPPLVPLRYLIAFTTPVLLVTRERLTASGAAPDAVERMHAAWAKAVMLSIALWARPYAGADLW